MVRLVQVDKTLVKLDRERRRTYSVLGPTATGTSFTSSNTAVIEEPEMLLDIECNFFGESLVTNTADDNMAQNVFVLEGTTGFPTAPSQATGLGLNTGNGMVLAFFARSIGFSGDGGAATAALYTEHADHRKQWTTWAYLLEEDDVLFISITGSKTVTDTDWVNVQLSIVTAVNKPRRL